MVRFLLSNQSLWSKAQNPTIGQIIGDLSIYLVGIPWLAHFVGWSDGATELPSYVVVN
jgi:biotin transporter BioY